MATISACAVGSFSKVTLFAPVAITRSSLTTRAPKGPPRPARTFSVASAIACRTYSSELLANPPQYSNGSQCDNTHIPNTKQAIRSRRLVLPDGVRPGCIVFDEGRIVALETFAAPPPDAALLDYSDYLVLPGLIDVHAHINEPGRTEWEGFATATRAAAAGGFTCVIDMPLNSIPATTNVSALDAKRAAAQGKATVDYGFWGGAVQGNAADLQSLAVAGVRGFKSFLVHPGIEEFTMVREADLRKALPAIAESGLPLLVHAEAPGPIAEAERELSNSGADWRQYSTYLRSRPPEAELAAIQMLLDLCREYRFRLHIVHLATACAVPILKAAREEGLPVTVETCPHYLYFSDQSINSGATIFKCAPPIRDVTNREALWQALKDGVIDLIATDHSPCPPALKRPDLGDFKLAWGGIASLSVALSAIWTAAHARGFCIADIARWMAESPAQLAGLQSTKGRIAPGFEADFTIFDPDAQRQITPESLHFRHPISPYVGEKLRGEVRAAFVRGRCVYSDGSFPASLHGRECLQ